MVVCVRTQDGKRDKQLTYIRLSRHVGLQVNCGNHTPKIQLSMMCNNAAYVDL